MCSFLIAETCRCEKTVTTALTPSPLDKDGVLSGIISDVIKESCGNCQEHGETELVFEQSSEQGNTEPDLNFPVTAASVRGSQYSKYLPVLEVPGMVVIERNEAGVQSEVYQKVVTSSILDNWPILVLAILTMVLAGIVIWILVCFYRNYNGGILITKFLFSFTWQIKDAFAKHHTCKRVVYF